MGYKNTAIADINHLGSRADLIPKIGMSYINNKKLSKSVRLLNNWLFESALNNLDKMIQINISRIDALLLKGEVLALFEENNDAAVVFDEILASDPNNIYAHIGRVIQLERMNADVTAINKSLTKLRDLSPVVYRHYIDITNFMQNNKNRFDMQCKSNKVDALLVCGYVLNSDGSLPEKLVKRLSKTVDLSMRYKDAQVVLSGAAVQNSFSEAEAMKQYLVQYGVEPERINTFDKARDTVGNVIEFLEYLSHHSSQSVCIITSRDHLPRAWMTMSIGAKQSEMNVEILGEAPEESIDEKSILKEHQLNYQTLYRMAGLMEKKDIDVLIKKDDPAS